MVRGDFMPLFLLGVANELAPPIMAMAGYVEPLVQLGALGLLAAYLFWTIKERNAERLDRAEFHNKEREMRLAEIKAIADSHIEMQRHHTAALQRAYEGNNEE